MVNLQGPIQEPMLRHLHEGQVDISLLSPSCLEIADVGVKLVLNAVTLAMPAFPGRARLKDLHVLVKTGRGLSSFFSGRLRSGLSPALLTGSHSDRARLVTTLIVAQQLLINPLYLGCQYSTSQQGLIAQGVGACAVLASAQGTISRVLDGFDQLEVLAYLYSAQENQQQANASGDPEAIKYARIKVFQSVLDLVILVVAVVADPRVKAALSLVAVGLSAYRIYQGR